MKKLIAMAFCAVALAQPPAQTGDVPPGRGGGRGGRGGGGGNRLTFPQQTRPLASAGGDRARQGRLRRQLHRVPRRRSSRRRSGRTQPPPLADCVERSARRGNRADCPRLAPGQGHARLQPRRCRYHRGLRVHPQRARQGGLRRRVRRERSIPSTLNVLVGNASAGEAYFKSKCASCHSITRRPERHRRRSTTTRERCRTPGYPAAVAADAVAAAVEAASRARSP